MSGVLDQLKDLSYLEIQEKQEKAAWAARGWDSVQATEQRPAPVPIMSDEPEEQDDG